ncbi:radical SAM protein [Yoonia sp. GPGPB17]|uniref:radical SAM protein n=1 Tax=Yoonia sp. GPGPB17 TaxID=3026147 RepID=UPI0030BD5261
MLTKTPVVQIHLSRFCNLKCLHCYSSSSPTERHALPVEDVLRTTAALSKSGYRRVSLSGGEPVLAPGFRALANGLAAQGFDVAVITNGTRPGPLMKAMAEGAVHHASVSFDGPEPIHDMIRGRNGSFRTALKTLQELANCGYSCGAVLSVTKHSFPHLPDVVELVRQTGAAHIQLHPIALSGRARRQEETVGPELSPEALLRLVAVGRLLQNIYPDLQIQADALLGEELHRFKHSETDLISPLVIADDGALLPFCFDISRKYSLGQLGEPGLDFRLGARLKSLLDTVTNRLADVPATNFYRELVVGSACDNFSGTTDDCLAETVE